MSTERVPTCFRGVLHGDFTKSDHDAVSRDTGAVVCFRRALRAGHLGGVHGSCAQLGASREPKVKLRFRERQKTPVRSNASTVAGRRGGRGGRYRAERAYPGNRMIGSRLRCKKGEHYYVHEYV